jgi:hypothetical protein
MNLLKLGTVSAIVAAMVMAAAPLVGAAAKYGDAVVEQGSMTIIREGRSLSFRASGQPVAVNEQDLVRVRENSRVVLQTADKAAVTLGSNAVFHVQPWQQQENRGVFRMLFGRFRATVTGLAGGERFNVKTATATIGVKGTEYSSAVTSGGYTSVLGIESTVENTGSDGVAQPVNPGQVSVTASPATPAVPAPQAFIDAMRDLNSPSPWNPQALYLPAMQALIDAGIVSPSALDKWKQEQAGPETESGPKGDVLPPPNFQDAQQQGQLFKGKLQPQFQK